MGKNGVDQRAGPMPGGRMNHHSRRLVDYQNRLVFIDDGKRNRLGKKMIGNRPGPAVGNDLFRLQPAAGTAADRAVDLDPPLLNPFLHLRAGQRGVLRSQIDIQPQTGVLPFYGKNFSIRSFSRVIHSDASSLSSQRRRVFRRGDGCEASNQRREFLLGNRSQIHQQFVIGDPRHDRNFEPAEPFFEFVRPDDR